MIPLNDQAVEICRKNFKRGNITLYLGAGVSIDNNIPSWGKLILAMYFATISEQEMPGWRPYPNYLYAIAEWYLKNSPEPFEIIARKLLKYYNTPDKERAFLDRLYSTLYGSLIDERGNPPPFIDGNFIRNQNPILKALSEVISCTPRGINSVITYNYDNLLEMALENLTYKPIYKPYQSFEDELPIFHVHGYVPLDKNPDSSRGFDLIFTEDQYNKVTSDVYHWSNLIQIQKMANSVGIMVGLSLSDRNMRRLLDAVGRAPINSINFALLQMPDYTPPNDKTLDEIHFNAIKLLDKFRGSGIKSIQNEHSAVFQLPGIKSDGPNIKSSRMGEKGPSYRYEISGIIEAVKRLDLQQQEYVLRQLRIIPIWFNEFRDIPVILKKLLPDNQN